MPKIVELSGRRFGMLLVLDKDTRHKSKNKKWNCICDCGNSTSVYSTNLMSGDTKSCGCLSGFKKNHVPFNKTHGMSNTRLYHVYYAMLSRCKNPTDKVYHHYGGRGITISDEWAGSFETFLEWSTKNGYCEGLTLERINVNDGYSPSNCTWIPQSEQPCNRRNTLKATINGETKTLSEWAIISGITYSTLHARKSIYGWKDENLLKPIQAHKSHDNLGEHKREEALCV